MKVEKWNNHNIRFIDKEFNDLNLEDLRYMRRNKNKNVKLKEMIDFYGVSLSDYYLFIRNTKGISITKDERKMITEEKNNQQQKKNKKKQMIIDIENLPDVYIATIFKVDFEITRGERVYDQKEMNKCRKIMRDRVLEYDDVMKETKNGKAYSDLKGIYLKAMRMFRGYNTTEFAALSGLKQRQIKQCESRENKVPSFIIDIYSDKLSIKDRHLVQIKEIMEGKAKSIIDDRTIPPLIKLEVFKRDKGKCTKCSNSNKLHYHHKKHFSKGGRHTVSNLELLCVSCHAEEHKGEQVYKMLKSLKG